jgi:diaminopimelate decarboxylase
MKPLEKEANWTLQKALQENLITEEDTAVIFQSWNQLEVYLTHLKEAFPANTLHAIAIKTNPHPKVLKKISDLGFGLEAASMEEVQLAIDAGVEFSKIIFDSPVKTKLEIDFCNKHLPGIRLNVNSLEELTRMPQNPTFTLGIRINPMIETGAPDIYHVSSDESKFGVPIIEKKQIIDAIIRFPVTQLHVHAGSHMTELDASIEAVKALVELAIEANQNLELNGIKRKITTLDIGGGLPPEQLEENKQSYMQQYALGIVENCPNISNFTLITEFGQWCYFYTGYAFSRVEYTLIRGEKKVLFIHLGADYLMRDAYVKPRGVSFLTFSNYGVLKTAKASHYDIAGPLCFAGDYVTKNQLLQGPEEGDWLALINTGSNSIGLWSRHCSRMIPKVIGCDMNNQSLEILSERFSPFV